MKRLPVFLAVIIFILYGCVTPATTQNEWSNPEAKIDSTKVFQKILLVALVKDNATRKIVEDKLAEQVKPRGVVSYNYLPNLETNESTLSNKLKTDGFDGIVIMRLATPDKNAYDPGKFPPSYSSWYGYYSTTYPRYNDPNYYSSTTVYNIETNVYSLKDNKLLWTGITTAPNLSDKKAMMDRVIAMIKQKMKSQGVLK